MCPNEHVHLSIQWPILHVQEEFDDFNQRTSRISWASPKITSSKSTAHRDTCVDSEHRECDRHRRRKWSRWWRFSSRSFPRRVRKYRRFRRFRAPRDSRLSRSGSSFDRISSQKAFRAITHDQWYLYIARARFRRAFEARARRSSDGVSHLNDDAPQPRSGDAAYDAHRPATLADRWCTWPTNPGISKRWRK